jgi:hypothetical protein
MNLMPYAGTEASGNTRRIPTTAVPAMTGERMIMVRFDD